jgi:hypothetical protein
VVDTSLSEVPYVLSPIGVSFGRMLERTDSFSEAPFASERQAAFVKRSGIEKRRLRNVQRG